MRRAAASILLLVLCVFPLARVHAEIERVGNPTEHGIELMWWPKVAPPADWEHVKDVSYANHINMFAPKGENFADAPAVMYARAIYFEKGNTGQELEDAIRDDHAGFKERFPDSKVARVEEVKTGDGTPLRTFSFTPQSDGHWELVAYGREPKYVLMFCVSAKSQEALENSRPAFLAMVRSYTSRDEP
jgi:hypothetical protein